MSRYIDADLIRYDEDIPGVFIASKTRINNIPTADVRENVKGHWVDIEPDMMVIDTVDHGGGAIVEITKSCSVCKTPFLKTLFDNFCPYCGADMRQTAERI